MAVSATTRQNYEAVSYRGPNLAMHSAQAREIIPITAATTLDIKQSGALVVFDVASGATVTLPSPTLGAYFDFQTATTITSGSAKVLTGLSTEFLLGAISTVNSGATTAQAFAANGTTHRSVNGNGTTTGGIIGDNFRLTAINTTQWAVSGTMVNTGTAATMFATS